MIKNKKSREENVTYKVQDFALFMGATFSTFALYVCFSGKETRLNLMLYEICIAENISILKK